MTQTIPFYRGLRLRDLDESGEIRHPLEYGAESRRAGRPYGFAPVRIWEGPADPEAAEYPFEMMAGRCMYHFGSMSTRSKNLRELCPEGYVEINAADAEELGVSDGDTVRVESPGSWFQAPARISDKVDSKMVFVPTNFPKSWRVHTVPGEHHNVQGKGDRSRIDKCLTHRCANTVAYLFSCIDDNTAGHADRTTRALSLLETLRYLRDGMQGIACMGNSTNE